MVGLGLLGTFLGLTLGILGFHSDSSEAIQGSIQSLLGGMGTAFLTSLFGMGFSCYYIFQEKRLMNTFEKYLDNICYILNKKYYLSENDFLAAYLSFKDEQGNNVYLSNAVRDMYAETHKQTGFMGTLVDDLSDALDEKLSDNINEKVIPIIEKFVTTLSDKLDMLKTSIQSPAEDMTHTIVDELKASMNDLMEKFGTELSGSATSNLTSLTENLAKASDSLFDLPAQMKNMSEQLAVAFGGIHTTIEDLESAVKKIVEQSANSNKDLVERAASQYSRMEESHQQISSQTDVLIANFNDMVDTLNTTVKEVQGSMVQIKETKNALVSLVVSLQGVTNNMDKASTRIKNSQESYVSGLKEVQEKSSTTVTNITSALQLSKNTLEDYSNKFGIIQQGLSGIFAHIKTGLDQYSTTVSQSARTVLNGYSSALTDGINKLQQATSHLGDLVSEINDTIEYIKKEK
ncbi:hypothetical protein HMPREF9018_0353 [Prevotella amnii CRIS 21A-A]|uniref:MotA/TolQ/ExbB proton channel domain-containing protein n=1 Tax=Prevotella amnii CRIS 21A-A TaxID=679191 RepID=E1GXY4_9BACT|nr:hypothetical protein [Prevotella amnii]EFN90481.1 hypothetical protein HMPREF9018_0353 [Prevotella amnii CRIS 21A-A]